MCVLLVDKAVITLVYLHMRGREGGREEGREGGRKGGREGGREGRREGGLWHLIIT